MNSICRYYNEQLCQSCGWISLPYSEQLLRKESILREIVPQEKILPTVASPHHGFRTKAKFSVSGTLEAPVIGILDHKDLCVGTEILGCPIHHPQINDLLPSLKRFIQEARLVPYNVTERSGELKGLIIFHSSELNETYLRFILRSKESLDRLKKHYPKLQRLHPHLKVITANLQPIPHAILEGKEEVFFTQQQKLRHKLGTVEVQVDPRSFIQTNETIARSLYETAASWVSDCKPKSFLELYSGLGLFSFFVAKRIETAIGLEINPHAVEEANRTAMNLELSHLTFKCVDAENASEEISKAQADVVLVNPPRKGLGAGVDSIIRQRPKYLVYSSCSHETLGKDLEKLKSIYSIEKAQIFDMFPHTSHFETLVFLKSNDA